VLVDMERVKVGEIAGRDGGPARSSLLCNTFLFLALGSTFLYICPP